MITNLTVINLKANSHASPSKGDVFVLKTCQRTLVMGLGEAPFLHLRENALREDVITDIFEGQDAYVFLLETICGLRSEVVAEYEVVGQFKDAYQEFLKSPERNNHVMMVLEKLFQDNKKVRTDHLTEIGQLTYAGIARKLIHTAVSDGDVLVLGSGTLAEDLIKLLKKKHNVFISARNDARVAELSSTYGLESIAWGAKDIYARFPFIVNTIGADEVLFDELFFLQFFGYKYHTSPRAQMKLFIDLGSPSVIETSLTEKDGVLRLEDIFRQSAKLNIEKMEKVNKARSTIASLAEKRARPTLSSTPFDWEELQFAYSL
nr:glutamyl-tRNA reductase [Bacteriovorax sp. HI3]